MDRFHCFSDCVFADDPFQSFVSRFGSGFLTQRLDQPDAPEGFWSQQEAEKLLQVVVVGPDLLQHG